jgi:hypothetical protein
MGIGRALTAIFMRGVIFCFVVAAVGPWSRDDLALPAHLAAVSRACIGFAASVTLTVMLMLALSIAASPPKTVATLELRGTI